MTINLNGDEFYSEQEVEERIREAIAGKDDKVNMEKLPIGTLVKVVGDASGHCHGIGEILPITEVDMDDEPSYRLDDRISGWVDVEDIEFVSLPEEEESTSGDEEESELGFKVGDKVRVKGAIYHDLEGGYVGTIREIAESIKHTHNGRLIPTPYEVSNSTDIGQWVAPEHLELIDGESEEDSEKYPAVGTKVKAKRETPWTTVGKVYEVLGITEPRPYPIRVSDDEDDDIYTLKMFEEFFEILKPSEEDDSEIKAGDIVIATEDEFGITEGVEYEIKEYETGTLYFLDDDGDIRHVSVHEEYLRKKSNRRGFKRGDVVYVNEEITDYSGDTICPGVLAEFILDRGVLTPDGSLVVVEDGDIGKLTLVCRAEDRLDV